VFICVLALQVERWMRNKLRGVELSDGQKGVSVPKAIELLKRIKTGEMEASGKKLAVPTRTTPEQNAILAALGVSPIPSALQKTSFVVQHGLPESPNIL
jgi:hypothetical protein